MVSGLHYFNFSLFHCCMVGVLVKCGHPSKHSQHSSSALHANIVGDKVGATVGDTLGTEGWNYEVSSGVA